MTVDSAKWAYEDAIAASNYAASLMGASRFNDIED